MKKIVIILLSIALFLFCLGVLMSIKNAFTGSSEDNNTISLSNLMKDNKPYMCKSIIHQWGVKMETDLYINGETIHLYSKTDSKSLGDIFMLSKGDYFYYWSSVNADSVGLNNVGAKGKKDGELSGSYKDLKPFLSSIEKSGELTCNPWTGDMSVFEPLQSIEFVDVDSLPVK